VLNPTVAHLPPISMVANVDRLVMSASDYLAWEAEQSIRHEYFHGAAYAMVGGTLAHNAIALNIASWLRGQLRGTGCRAYMADAKVQISPVGPYFYPDGVVTCDDRDRQATSLISYPKLIIEVLSPSTAGFDRGDKFKAYRRLPSLREYLLVDATQVSVDRYYRNSLNQWILTSYPAVEQDQETDWEAIAVNLESLELTASLGMIYEEVQLL